MLPLLRTGIIFNDGNVFLLKTQLCGKTHLRKWNHRIKTILSRSDLQSNRAPTFPMLYNKCIILYPKLKSTQYQFLFITKQGIILVVFGTIKSEYTRHSGDYTQVKFASYFQVMKKRNLNIQGLVMSV